MANLPDLFLEVVKRVNTLLAPFRAPKLQPIAIISSDIIMMRIRHMRAARRTRN
jgi:hypothetical protein